MIYYSASEKGFFHSDNGGNLPHDAVEVSQEHYENLFILQSRGLVIVPAADGTPMAVGPTPPSVDEKPPVAPVITKDQINSSMLEQIAALEAKQNRAVREFLLGRPEALKLIQQYEIDITYLRSRLA